MDFKLPIYHIGVALDANHTIKIAILQKTCKGWIVSHCEQISKDQEWLPPKKYLTSSVTFSLRGTDSLIRSSLSSLRNKNNILKIALTDLETNAPFPWNSLVVAPQLGKRNESGETPVTLWVTQKARAEREVALLHKARIFPDRLSCQPADIFSFVQQTPLKALPAYFLVYTGSSETSCLFVQNGSVLVSRSFGNAQDNCENIVTTLDYVKETYPSIELSAIHTVHIPEGLKKSLENKLSLPLIACQTTTFGLEEEEWANYGDAIITAYHGVSKRTLVLPYNPVFNCAESQKHWFKRSALVIGKLALLSSAIVGIGSTLKLASLSHRVREHFALACPETPKIPKSLCGLEEALRTAVSSNSHSEYPYLPTIPTSKETMLFLSSMSQNTPSVKLSYFCYSLVSFPSQQNPTLPYKANISVKGEGNPEDVSEFLRKISMHPKLSNIMQTSSSGRTFELQFTIVSQEVL
ncbi:MULTISPECIES: hypothetical protein [Chlamydia]|uniref:Inner membrane protein n=2 Tax=Chlamydia TaxID=810 RepID=A0ABN0MQ65_CHLPS|nr:MULTISPECIES: hypothetical protein [Chlamydia]AFS23268.1 putative inner membrane protein [Chlamydia psittaci VS225]EPJ15799.1 putative inner membrane protein [Chlamydia psittaci 02DC18]EPJ17319.1 putative inner membrane protein [Chlamydia psittaci 02DC22]EPJ19658.1 putative inner membrane protein [Chlamydia psittaci 02DC23]EPJ20764.1 putative inner membrane protein [Chlamydia psittaci 02DC21]EPJ25064.1 putative inner membrane protein [Chlamydia psittaci 03DC29]EPJ99913.1 putative inner me